MEQDLMEGPVLVAFRLSEERAAEGYLAARREMVARATRVASVRRLVAEQRVRADYRSALRAAEAAYRTAEERTELAFERWQVAQLRTDARWTETYGKAA
ncbi:hypothetical protein [Amycolatopsis sp. GM8]|uniref:hypothetical protein n=1 Tax=Amycolatopsis sp. GM8 TaxID=2896530 RepID=UPI001F206887|nr:hypothetical protein [Amycolatopsis sp. GM8]